MIWTPLPDGIGRRSTKRCGWILTVVLQMPPSCTYTAHRKPDVYNKDHLQTLSDVFQAWMISQIPGGAKGLEQPAVCKGKTLRGSAMETEDGRLR